MQSVGISSWLRHIPNKAFVSLWLLVSFLFGLLSIFPFVATRFDSSFGFQGIEMQGTDAEPHYGARVQEIRDGNLAVANLFYAGPKDQPYLQPPLPEMVVSLMGAPFGLDAARSLALSQFVFGFLVAFVMIGFFCQLTRRPYLSLVGVSLFLFAGYLLSDPFWFFRSQSGDTFLTFVRPINPQITSTLFFGALWAMVSWIRSESRSALLTYVVLGTASVYSYVYSWSLLAVITCFVVAEQYVHGAKKKALTLLAAGVAILLLSIPYFVNLWNSVHDPFYQETSMRLGLIQSRQPVLGLSVIALFILAFFAYKRFRQHRWFVFVFACASLVAINQQIITGRSIASSHYHWYFIKPFTAVAFFILAGEVLMGMRIGNYLRKYRTVFVSVLLVVLMLMGAVFQYRSYQFAKPFWSSLQPSVGVLRYLYDHASGKTIYARTFVRDLIPEYTSANVYWATNAYMYLSPDERARNAYFFDLWIDGFPADQAESAFQNERRAELSSRLHSIYYREYAGSYGAMPIEEAIFNAHAYSDFSKKSFEDKIDGYPLDYVVIDKTQVETDAVKEIKSKSKMVYEDQYYQIWSLGVES